MRHVMKLSSLALISLLSASLAACTSSRWYGISYQPAPLEVAVASTSVSGTQLRVLASVLGVARADDSTPAHVEMRLRAENLGSVEAKVRGDGFSLVSADLAQFGAPRVQPSGDTTIAPGKDATIDLSFALPAGRGVNDVEWSGLNLRFTVEFQGSPVTTGMSFARVSPVRMYEEPRWSFGFGVGTRW